ncbi:MAG: elongation factor P [Buchnera aphidicola (Periphyllus acericola)]|uniref:elongation factor P n=1 Tax=Buchnera aphidicola TaxID=9 RepID=UPI0030D5D1BC|nr:elongation factor P [Buchnera aphidicola (Periphyllus acericola)]
MIREYSIHSLKPGLKVIIFKKPCVIQSSKFVKPGKGQAFSRVKFKNILSGKIVETTFKSTDFFKIANVKDVKVIYLYNNSAFWYFLDNKNFEEFIVTKKIIGIKRFWIIPQCKCSLTIWKNEVISISLKNFVYLKIEKTISIVKKNSINKNMKSALLNTGISIKVPYFINVNDIIKIDTRTGKYVSRN